jgi:DNA-binding IclR family transcriptional regulator
VNWLGGRYPVHCTASGKAFLAFGPAAVRERLLARRLERVTPHTITDRARLEEQLAEARRSGLAVTHGELEVGLDAMAAPVFGPGGDMLAAVDVSGPSHRLATRPDLDRMTKEAAADLSRRLGYRPQRAET